MRYTPRALLIAAVMALGLPAAGQPFVIEQPTIAGGGGEVAAGGFVLRGTVNPTAGGLLVSGDFELIGGLFPLDRAAADCPADVNGNGVTDPGDFTAWIAAYNTSTPACDQNGDGLCTPDDFTAWVANYNAGCP
ncbi:MAG: GC-type dockerin domain-anchored protein [Phycisphaerales bacterium]